MRKIAKLLAFTLAFAMVMSMMVMPASAAYEYSYPYTNLISSNEQLLYVNCVYTDSNGTYCSSSTTPTDAGCTVVQAKDKPVTYDSTEAAYRLDKYLATQQSVRYVNIPGFAVGDHVYVEAKVKWANSVTAGETDSRNVTIAAHNSGNAGVGSSVVSNNLSGFSVTDEYKTIWFKLKITSLGTAQGNFHLGFGFTGTDAVYIKDFVIYKLPSPEILTGSWQVGPASTNNDGSYTFGTTTDTDNCRIVRKVNMVVEPNKYYFVTALVKDADGTITNASTASMDSKSLYSCYSCSGTTMTCSDVTVGTEYKRISGYVKTGASTCSSHNHSTENLYKLHMGFVFTAANSGAAEPVTVKNFEVYEVDTKAAVTASGETVDITFANPTALTSDGVTVSGGTAALTKNSETSYTITLSNIEKGAEYTVKAVGTDMFGIPVTATTTYTPDPTSVQASKELIALSDMDGDFNTVNTGNMVSANSDTVTVSQETIGDEKVMKVAATAKADPAFRINSLCGGKTLNNTGKYIITCKIKLADGSTDNGIKLWVSKSVTNTNTRYPSSIVMSNHTLSSTEWTTVSGTFTMNEYTSEHVDKSSSLIYKYPQTWSDGPFHIGISCTGATTFYVDKVEVKEVKELDLTDNVLAAVAFAGSKLTLDVAADEAETVYVMAAKYVDGQMTAVKLDKAVLAEGALSDSLVLDGVDNTYKLFVWNASQAPLSNSLSISEIE